jgi:hypothetical protein
MQGCKCMHASGHCAPIVDQAYAKEASVNNTFFCVQSVLEGYNGTIMAYGQTGTGKTYTLGSLGTKDPSQKGIMARSMDTLLENTDRSTDSVSISYLQLYNERVQDLLDPDRDNLAVQEDSKTGEVQVPGEKQDSCFTASNLEEEFGSTRHGKNAFPNV